jgi:hypothetical protein
MPAIPPPMINTSLRSIAPASHASGSTSFASTTIMAACGLVWIDLWAGKPLPDRPSPEYWMIDRFSER